MFLSVSETFVLDTENEGKKFYNPMRNGYLIIKLLGQNICYLILTLKTNCVLYIDLRINILFGVGIFLGFLIFAEPVSRKILVILIG